VQLAQVIYTALRNPSYCRVLDAGAIPPEMAGLSAYERVAVLEVLHYRWPRRRTPRGSLFAWLYGNVCSWQANK
jgi:hypothetical protein